MFTSGYRRFFVIVVIVGVLSIAAACTQVQTETEPTLKAAEVNPVEAKSTPTTQVAEVIPAVANSEPTVAVLTGEADPVAETETGGAEQEEEPVSEELAAEVEAPWPSPRIHPTMLYDPATELILMLSGMTGMQRKVDLSEVWTFDAGSGAWELVGGIEPGDALITYGFDQESGQIVTLNNKPRGTWSYDLAAGTWEQKEPSTMPSEVPALGRRFGPSMAYDAESDRLILFGGGAPGKLFADTWAYDSNNDRWEEMQPASSPSPRAMYHMAYDAESDRVILWGGFMEEGVEDVLIWAYDYNNDSWESFENTDGPQLHWERGGMVYLPDHDRFLFFTGIREHEDRLVEPETWYYDYDANSWTRVETENNPPATAMYAMVYDPSTDRVVLFGGERGSKYSGDITDDVWLFDPQEEEWSLMPAPPGDQG